MSSNRIIGKIYRSRVIQRIGMQFAYLNVTLKKTDMITSAEIRKILQAQKVKKIKFIPGFDSAILGLGIHLKNKKTVVVKN